MKKTLALLILLAVSGFSLSAFAQVKIHSDVDKVSYTENTICGDSSVADGITVSLSNECGLHAFWNTDYCFGEPDTVSTDFNFYLKSRYVDNPKVYDGIYIYANYFESNEVREYADSFQDDLSLGETKTIDIKLSDWYEYIPLTVDFDFPSGVLKLQTDVPDMETCVKTFSDFFKIPVDDSDVVTAYVYDDMETEYAGIVNPVSSVSTICDDACYFALCRDGNAEIDMSLIKGGNGIYKLPYDTREDGKEYVRTKDIDTVFSFGDDIYPQTLWANDTQTQLLMTYEKDGEDYLAVIDKSTMSLLQTIKIPLKEIYYMDVCGSFVVFYIQGFKHVTVYAESESGKWEQRIDTTDEKWLDFYDGTYYGTWLLDNDRLVFAHTNMCGFDIAVFGKEKVEYAARFDSSLECIGFGIDKVYDKPTIKTG